MNEERKVVEYKIEKVANLIEVKFPNGICSFSHKRGLLEFFQQRVELGDEPGELRLVVQNIFLFLLNQVDIKLLLFHWQFTKCSFSTFDLLKRCFTITWDIKVLNLIFVT